MKSTITFVGMPKEVLEVLPYRDTTAAEAAIETYGEDTELDYIQVVLHPSATEGYKLFLASPEDGNYETAQEVVGEMFTVREVLINTVEEFEALLEEYKPMEGSPLEVLAELIPLTATWATTEELLAFADKHPDFKMVQGEPLTVFLEEELKDAEGAYLIVTQERRFSYGHGGGSFEDFLLRSHGLELIESYEDAHED